MSYVENGWYPLRLGDSSIIDHLNDYLESGWRLYYAGLEGLPFLKFSIPNTSTLPPLRTIDDIAEKLENPPDVIEVLLLRYDPETPRQKAALLERDEKGYWVDTIPDEELLHWKSFCTMLDFEDGKKFRVYQESAR